MTFKQRCNKFCCDNCVNGSCQIANSAEYEERGGDVIHSCEECFYYAECKDCIFSGTEVCSNGCDK